MFRKPKTVQERRSQEQAGEVEGEVKFRKRLLPSSWDDISANGGHIFRSWKKHRRTQFRIVTLPNA